MRNKKKLWGIRVAVMACVVAVVCFLKNPTADASPANPSVPASGSATVKAALLEVFERRIGSKEAVRVSGYVFAEDGAYGLDGVVQYEDAGGCPWKLAFIHDGSVSPVSQSWEPGHVLVGKLAYLGNGVVRAYVKNTDDGSLYACTMAYSYDEETRSTNFESAVNRVQLSHRLRRDRLNACPFGSDGLSLSPI